MFRTATGKTEPAISAFRYFLLIKKSCLLCFIGTILFQSSFAAEGTLGWHYWAYPAHGFDVLYAPTPIEACQRSSRPGGWKGMAHIARKSGANGDAYDCWLKPLTPSDQPLKTLIGLICSDGYSARAPGICVKNQTNVTNTIPLVTPPTSLAPIECSASNPGFTMGNPVILATGTKIQQERDHGGNQWGTLEIGRIYRYARNSVNAPTAGSLWSFGFERQFSLGGTAAGGAPPRVSIINGDGSSIVFNKIGSRYLPEIASAAAVYPLTPAYDEWIYKTAKGALEHFKK